MINNVAVSKQTLDEFLREPFGNKTEVAAKLKYEKRYKEYIRHNKIKIKGTTESNNSWMIHLTVPSESNKNEYEYDVVILFFNPDKESKNKNLKDYYVQFYSNSPGFVYRYATLYRINGYLIEALQNKFTKGTLSTLPESSNPTFKLFYDSSIYYACRYIHDKRFSLLSRLSFRMRRLPFDKFISNISDFESTVSFQELKKLEKNLNDEITREGGILSYSQEKKLLKKNNKYSEKIDTSVSKSKRNKSFKIKTGGISIGLPGNKVKFIKKKRKISKSKAFGK